MSASFYVTSALEDSFMHYHFQTDTDIYLRLISVTYIKIIEPDIYGLFVGILSNSLCLSWFTVVKSLTLLQCLINDLKYVHI